MPSLLLQSHQGRTAAALDGLGFLGCLFLGSLLLGGLLFGLRGGKRIGIVNRSKVNAFGIALVFPNPATVHHRGLLGELDCTLELLRLAVLDNHLGALDLGSTILDQTVV